MTRVAMRAERKKRRNQKLMGVAMVAISIVIAVLDQDSTSMLIIGGLGVWVATTKEYVLY